MRPVRWSPSLLSIALGAALTACAGAPPNPPPAGTATPTATAIASAAPDPACVLSGVVQGDSGLPVPDAIVAAVPPGGEEPREVAHGDKQGRYCFKSLPPGPYGFTTTAPRETADYIDVRDFDPAKSKTMDIHLMLPHGHTLRGRVTDEKGAPMPGVRVYLVRTSDFLADLFVTEADADGRYAVNVPSGARFTPKILLEEFASSSGPVEVKSDVVADIHLERLNPKGRPAPDEVVAWVKQKAIPLRTTEAGKGFDDMEPLRAIVGDARLVAMGEATHGSREFFQMKHRMLEFLVTQMGFRSFGIEASFGDCLPLAEYVRTGKGDPAAALANQGFWTWDTEEVLALVKWMRAWNADAKHKEKVSFWGIDMQSSAASAQALVAYLQKVDPAFAKEIAKDLTLLDDDFSAREVHSHTTAEMDGAAEATKRLADTLSKNKDAYVKKSSARDHALAMIHARVLVEYVPMVVRHDTEIRDRAMAKIASELLELESTKAPAKMALWAHNGHIDRHDNNGGVSLGSELARMFDKGYVTFGFSFDEGSFQAVDMGKEHRGLTSFTVGAMSPGSFDHTLSRAGIPLFALDLRTAPAGVVADWLGRPSFVRWMGATFDEAMPDYSVFTTVPRRSFDAVFFVQKTTTARANDTGQRPPRPQNTPPPEVLLDAGFESVKVQEARAEWRLLGIPRQLEYTRSTATSGCAEGARCLVLERTKGDVATGTGTVSTVVSAAAYRGKKVRVTASVRVDAKSPYDKAFFTASTGEERVGIARAPGVSWTQVHVDVDVPADANRIVLAFVVTGAAKGYLDDIQIKSISN